MQLKINQVLNFIASLFLNKYLKAKVREFNGVIKTNFLGNDMPKENMHYTCIACITIDFVMKIDIKTIYLEEWKYKIKKNPNIQIHSNTELKSDSESELNSEEKQILMLN